MFDLNQFEQLGKKKLNLNDFVELGKDKAVTCLNNSVMRYIGKGGKYNYLCITIGSKIVESIGWEKGDKLSFSYNKNNVKQFLLRKSAKGNRLTTAPGIKNPITFRVRRNMKPTEPKLDIKPRGECESFSVEVIGNEKVLVVNL